MLLKRISASKAETVVSALLLVESNKWSAIKTYVALYDE
jgi:hypothetical protein